MSNKAKLSIFICLALLSPLFLCGDARTTRAQSGGAGRPEQFVMPLHGEGFIAFRIEAVTTAGAPRVSIKHDELQASLTPQATLADSHVVRRVLLDADGNFVFGYDLVVEPFAATKQFKVSLKPMSARFEEQLSSRQPSMVTNRAPHNVSTLPGPTEAQLIDDGDAFALDLLVNPQTGVKIVDVVKVSFDRARLWSAPRSLPLRDFTLGNVELAVRDYRLTINGEHVGGGNRRKAVRGCAGALVWFYVPERGRFIFSLIPHEGYNFQKVGRIENNRISFTLGGDAYEWTSSAPIVGTSGGNWNLWVLHDAGYVSDFDSQEQIIEGAQQGSTNTSTPNNSASTPEWLRDPLGRIRGERRAEFETRNDNQKRAARRMRVLVGGADRIENLLPRH